MARLIFICISLYCNIFFIVTSGKKTPAPVINPSMKPSISPEPTAAPTQLCVDLPGWKDSEGDGCLVYENGNLCGMSWIVHEFYLLPV